MLKSQSARVVAVGVAVLLFVLLLLVPRVPSEKSDLGSSPTRTVDTKVQEARRLMQSETPMQGILMLRDILEKNPDNVDALWVLGEASMQTGQFEKAVTRFERLISLDKAGDFLVANLYLGEAYAETGDKGKAIESFNRFLESDSNEELMQSARARIAELEK